MFLKILQNLKKNIFAGVSFLIKLQTGNLKLSEAATGGSSVKQGVLKNFANVTGKKPILKSLFNKVAVLKACNFMVLKKTPTKVLSCEVCKLFKNNYFEEHL